MERLLANHWQELPESEITRILETNASQGLDRFEIERRRARFGQNAITRRKAESRFILFLRQFHQPLVYILIAAAVITAVLKEVVDAGVIFGVVLVNAVIGFLQESKARRAIEALAASMSAEATVLRAGEKLRVDAIELVPGDLVLLESGDRVPADLRLLRQRELQVQEASLTGESVPVPKHTDQLPADTPLADRSNMAYSSTLVTHGIGAGVVVATGDGTEIGRINELIASADVLETPLTRKVAGFSKILLFVILGLAGVTFLVGSLRGEPPIDMFMAAVALAVGAIPEGLPAALTITLAIGVAKMARRHAIIRRLPAVETLGSTTVICTDKTGTLTQNRMTVTDLWSPADGLVGVGREPSEGSPSLRELLLAGAACNDARSVTTEDGEPRAEGDPTEAALLVAAEQLGVRASEADLPRIDVLPFESERQYMATLHDARGKRVAYVKGSAERILACCGAVWSQRGALPIDVSDVERITDEMAARGLRVLAFARKELPPTATSIEHADLESGLELLGMQGMIDPARPEAAAAVKACQAAGIMVKMVTGDHARTASAIAEQIALQGAAEGADARLVALTGREIAQLSDDELIDRAHRTAVFARVAPEQKLRLVRALQSAHVHRHVVAMTGDGVNDAPALKQADIGIAMGITGTEVAKESADMVLADDDFASIEAAVEEGRGVYDNLVKFITWTLPTNIGEGLVILVAVFAGLELPITPLQILWINMTTAVLLGLMLAFEPKEPGIMARPPREPKSPILTKTLASRIVLVGVLLLAGSFGLFELALADGRSLHDARTIAVNVFVVGELFYLFNCRSLRYSMFRIGVFSNRWVLAGVASMIVLQIAFTYVPVMNTAFGSAPIALEDWALIVAVGLAIYAIVGIEKWARRVWGEERDEPRRAAGTGAAHPLPA